MKAFERKNLCTKRRKTWLSLYSYKLLFIMCLTLLFTSCTKPTEDNKPNSGEEVTKTTEGSMSTNNDGEEGKEGNTTSDNSSNTTNTKWNIEEIRKNIVINGKKISLPFTLEELGEGYEFYEFTNPIVDKDLFSSIEYNGENQFSIVLYECTKETRTKKTLIYSLQVSVGNKGNCTVDGLNFQSTKQEVINKYGEPTIINEDEDDGVMEYKINSYQSMRFYYTYDKITTIQISYLSNEYLKGRNINVPF